MKQNSQFCSVNDIRQRAALLFMACICVALLALSFHSNAIAQGSRTLQCENEIIPHSDELIRRTREQAAADSDYARKLKETDATLTRAWNATLQAMDETRQKMTDLVQRWGERKASAHKLANGHAIGISKDGKVYDLDDKIEVAANASQYDWTGRPTWEEYLAVKTEYDALSAELDKLFTYYCQTLIPSRNRVVPYAKLNL